MANNIVSPENNDVLQYMNDSNVNSMFLNGVNRKEILDIIKSFANKTSTDYNGLNMFILKKITNFIGEPFRHICNLSLSKGVFPDAMKIARGLFHYLNQEINMFLIIIHMFHFYRNFLRFLKNYLITDLIALLIKIVSYVNVSMVLETLGLLIWHLWI